MKKLIAIAAIVIASVTTAQVKAQTPVEKICNSIDTFMKAQHPEYAKIERYKVVDVTTEGEPIFKSEIPLAFQVVPFPSDFPLEYGENANNVLKNFVNDINSEKNREYFYDLYSFAVIEKYGYK